MNRYVIKTDDVIHNINLIKSKTDCEIIGVIKGNGYGFDMEYMASLLKTQGIKTFAVTEISDALKLREHALIDDDILLLRSSALESEANNIVKADLTATIGSIKSAQALDNAAKKQNKRVKAHIKIDTGMCRYGFTEEETQQAAEMLKQYDNIDFVGIYTHFSSAFTQIATTEKQLASFKKAVKTFTDNGFDFKLIHCANSPAFFNLTQKVTESMTAVRIGSAFTGRVVTKSKSGLKKVGFIESDVLETKMIKKGQAVGYNGAFVAKHDTKLAIIPVGHFDGFGVEKAQDTLNFKTTIHSILSMLKSLLTKRQLFVTINDKKYPVAGHIGLSHTAVDVTGSDVKDGDIAKFDISPLFVNPQMKREYR